MWSRYLTDRVERKHWGKITLVFQFTGTKATKSDWHKLVTHFSAFFPFSPSFPAWCGYVSDPFYYGPHF